MLQPRFFGADQTRQLPQTLAPGRIDLVADLAFGFPGFVDPVPQRLAPPIRIGQRRVQPRQFGFGQFDARLAKERFAGIEHGAGADQFVRQRPKLLPVFFDRQQTIPLAFDVDQLPVGGSQFREMLDQLDHPLPPVVRLKHVVADEPVEALDVLDGDGLVEHVHRQRSHPGAFDEPAVVIAECPRGEKSAGFEGR